MFSHYLNYIQLRVTKHVAENADKQYNVISTSTMINKMTVSGLVECVSVIITSIVYCAGQR